MNYMTQLPRALVLVCVGAMASACSSSDAASSTESNVVEWDPSIAHIVPKKVHEYLTDNQWGDYHLIFHATRRYFVGGKEMRTWLDSVNEKYADLQEGDQWNGVEFLTMHAAMIEHLREKFGEVPVEDDPHYATFDDVLTGWDTDEAVLKAIDEYAGGQGRAKFQAALEPLNDFASFTTEDDFGLFLQTTLRISYQVNPDDTEQRFYKQATARGAGIHNTLHGIFADSESPIDVGDPASNLSNELFWGIHGWIEAKWEAFQMVHVRTDEEQQQYEEQLERFRLHMQIHSGGTGHEAHGLARAPRELRRSWPLFENEISCEDLEETTGMEGCQ